MLDDDKAIQVKFEPPDADVVWEHYLETCRRAGVKPVSREHAQDLIADWTETIAACLSGPPTTN